MIVKTTLKATIEATEYFKSIKDLMKRHDYEDIIIYMSGTPNMKKELVKVLNNKEKYDKDDYELNALSEEEYMREMAANDIFRKSLNYYEAY